MDFCFTGEYEKLNEFIDISAIDNVHTDYTMDKTEFRFFVDTMPKEEDFLNMMYADDSFDPEYDTFGGRYVFIVSKDADKIKEELKKAEEKAKNAPFFPMEWEKDGSERYVLSDVFCFDNMRECVKFMLVLMNSLNELGFFKLDTLILSAEFSSLSDNIKYIKNCTEEEMNNMENLHSTLAVFYIDSKIDGIEYMSKKTNDMYDMLIAKSDTKNHILQMFYVEDETYLEYYYWK